MVTFELLIYWARNQMSNGQPFAFSFISKLVVNLRETEEYLQFGEKYCRP